MIFQTAFLYVAILYKFRINFFKSVILTFIKAKWHSRTIMVCNTPQLRRNEKMEVFAELFKSPVGILSLITLLSICVIAAFLFFWVKKQADKSAKL